VSKMSVAAPSVVTTGGGGEMSIKRIPFSGQKDEWDNWKEKFLVKVSINAYDNLEC
jgi:hypothetical protein